MLPQSLPKLLCTITNSFAWVLSENAYSLSKVCKTQKHQALLQVSLTLTQLQANACQLTVKSGIFHLFT